MADSIELAAVCRECAETKHAACDGTALIEDGSEVLAVDCLCAKQEHSPVGAAVREMAWSTFTCAWCGVQPMRGTARDVDGTVLPTCGQEGHGTTT